MQQKQNTMNPMNCKYKKWQPTREEMPTKCKTTNKYQPQSTQVDTPAQNLKKWELIDFQKSIKRKQTNSSTSTT
jgi:hypothetical protein